MVGVESRALLPRPRAQVSAEYLLAFVAMLAIVSSSISFIFSASSGLSSIPQSYCQFDGGISCKGAMLVANKTGTFFLLIGSNAQQYLIKNISLEIREARANYSIPCTPGKVNPGAPFICFAKIDELMRPGSSEVINVIASGEECQLNSCNNAVEESFAGKINEQVSSYKTDNVALVLGAPQYKPIGGTGAQEIGLNVSLDLFGNNFTIEHAEIGNSSVVTTAYSPYAYFVNISKLQYTNNVGTMSVAFAGLASNESFIIDSKSISSLYCSNYNSTNLLLEILLTAYYSSEIKYPSGMSLFTCPLYNNYVYCVNNSASYFASLSNAESGIWNRTTAPSVPSKMFVCLAYDSVDYCFTNSSILFSPITSNGLSAWSVAGKSVLVNVTNCSSYS
mgnify:CR=1 FL=1